MVDCWLDWTCEETWLLAEPWELIASNWAFELELEFDLFDSWVVFS